VSKTSPRKIWKPDAYLLWSDGTFFINVPQHPSVEVYNLQQQELQRLEAPANIDTRVAINGPPAIYIAKIVADGKSVVHKLVVR
jgi:hypothetical protein